MSDESKNNGDGKWLRWGSFLLLLGASFASFIINYAGKTNASDVEKIVDERPIIVSIGKDIGQINRDISEIKTALEKISTKIDNLEINNYNYYDKKGDTRSPRRSELEGVYPR